MAMNSPGRRFPAVCRAPRTFADGQPGKRSMTIRPGSRIFRFLILVALQCGEFTMFLGCSNNSDHDSRGATPATETDQEIARILKDFGVRVHLVYNKHDYFSAHSRAAPVSAQGLQIEREAGIQMKRLIPGFLAMYPRALIVDNLHDIYVLKAMSLYGLKYGGSYSRGCIYVTNRGEVGGDHDLTLAAMMHSEFSSILFRNYGFPTEEWSKINEGGWRYVGSGKDLLGRRDLYDETEDLLRKGFVCVYGQASIEEDVNMYVFAAIHRKFSLISAAERHKRVKDKLEVLTRFYEAINERLHSAERFEFLIRLKSMIAPTRAGARPPTYVASQRVMDEIGEVNETRTKIGVLPCIAEKGIACRFGSWIYSPIIAHLKLACPANDRCHDMETLGRVDLGGRPPRCPVSF
jgi:hypothetical protein